MDTQGLTEGLIIEDLPEYTMAFGLGPMEIGVVLVLALLFFGPKRLPALSKSIGESIKGFKKGMNSDDDENEIDVTDSVKDAKIDESKKDTPE